MDPDKNYFMLSEKAYNFVRALVIHVLPALSAAYFSLDSIWDLPKEDEVVGTLAVIAVFLGAVMGVSSRNFNKSGFDGDVVVTETESGSTKFSLELNATPEELEQKKAIRFKVKPKTRAKPKPKVTEDDDE